MQNKNNKQTLSQKTLSRWLLYHEHLTHQHTRGFPAVMIAGLILHNMCRFTLSGECVFVKMGLCSATLCPLLYVWTIVTVNCAIHHPHWASWWPFVGVRSFVWTVVSIVTPCKIKYICVFVCPHLFISPPASLVNKVHSVLQLAGEMCVSVSILIQSISMGSMSYFVCCFSLCLCVWLLPE